MKIKTLEGISVSDIAQTFNDAFSDYLVPIRLAEQDLRDKMRAENTVLEYSAGAFEGEKLVGFSLIGLDNGIAYNGGTGVIPEFRGQNLTRQMYDFLLPTLSQRDIRKHLLEVITDNVRAVPVYQKIGFETVRTVVCFKGKVEYASQPDVIVQEIAIEHIRAEFCDSKPTYQNSTSALSRTREQNQTLGAFASGQLVGFIVFSPETARIRHFGIDKNYRRKGIGKRLFSQVQNTVGDKTLSLINIDESDGTIAFLERIGFEKTVSQFEMRLEC